MDVSLKEGTPTDYLVFDVEPIAFLEIGSATIDFKINMHRSKGSWCAIHPAGSRPCPTGQNGKCQEKP
jgi:hypothetical protein